ncbi:Transposase [Macleaya cordata]|uniref:Transposase n=1 Tax=Macleaya cordata TaxID=56857 RepID=A0A200QV04_MACCD|nr:Transposase [Macleaya cordata]
MSKVVRRSERLLNAKDVLSMEEDGTVMEIPSKEEDHSSNNSFVEGIGSSNPIRDPQSNPFEILKVDEMPVDHPHKDTDIVEQAVPILKVGVDLTQCFSTDKVFDSREEVIHWCQEVAKKNNTVLVISNTKSVNKPAGKGSVVELGCERGDREPALMNAIDVVFPGASRLLCTSHMTRDVVTNCKKAFEENYELWNDFCRGWEYVWKAKTKDEYMDAFPDFLMAWLPRYPSCIAYLRDTWLVHKEQFVLAWTQKIKHFGNTTIDRVESEHGQLKKHLGPSLGSFITCWEAMHDMINNEIVQIKASFEKSLTTVKHEHHGPAFKELRNHVSHHALELIQLELNRSEDVDIGVASCKCVLRSTHGLPCAHELIQYAKEGRPIPLSAIDSQWKQLSVVPLVEKRIDFDFLPEVQLLRQRWIEASETERCSLVEKLEEIAKPKTTKS